jgi:hypothetical protein
VENGEANEYGRAIVDIQSRLPKKLVAKWRTYDKTIKTIKFTSQARLAGDSAGIYGSRTMELATRSGSWSFHSPKPGAYNATSGLKGTAAHEAGHHLWRKVLGQKTKHWRIGPTKAIDPSDSRVKKLISKYGQTNREESFCEAFAMYTSPKYKPGMLGEFEKDLKAVLEID